MDGSFTEAAQHHAEGRLGAAETLYREILAHTPDDADVLHRLGVLALQTGNHAAAEALIRKAIDCQPDFADAYCNLGIALKSQGKLVEAADAYQTAVRINPEMAEAFSNLGIILESMGQIEDAITVYEKALQLEPNFADALSNYGIVLKHAGRYPEAILAFRKSLNLRPDTAAVWANLGAALVDIGEVEQASAALHRAIDLNPNLVAAHCNLGACFRELNQVEAAKEAFKRAIQIDPASVMALSMLAGLYENLNDLETAHDLARKALEIDPLNVGANLTAATCERRWKNWDRALARLESVDASLATDKVNAMVAKELGFIHDVLGEYSTAYDYYLEANRFQSTDWALRGIDGTEYLNQLIKLKKRFSLDWVKSWSPSDQEQRTSPVFMLGFPRSGTTLLDQILNAHPDIETLEEKPILEKVELGLGKDYPDALATLNNAEIVDLRAVYYSAMEQHIVGPRDLSKTYIEKLPLNTARVGLIHRLFPKAKIILSLRHPCDCCLSGFMQAFQPNPAMASFLDLEGAARLYALTMGLWRQYVEVLAIDYQQVRYEDIVANFETEARRIIEYLGLSWTDEIIDYREKMKGRRIATPSYHQVNEPIYRRSIERWRNYEEHFEKALPVLSPFIKDFGYSE